MADDTIDSVRSERDAARAELNDIKGELSGAKDRIRELNGEAGGHRSNYQREKRAREDLQTQLDSVTVEKDGLATAHAAELERQRIDLTARSADAERRANETIASYKDRQADLSLRTAATQLGMADLDGLKLLDRATLKINDDGEVENADEVLATFKEAKPYFFGAVPKPGTVTGNTTTTYQPPKPATPAGFDARTASPEEVAVRERELLGAR